MQPGSGQAQRCEQEIQLRDRASAHQGQRPMQPLMQLRQDIAQRGIKQNAGWMRGEFEQGAVHIQEQCAGVIQQERWWAAVGGHDGHTVHYAVASVMNGLYGGDSAGSKQRGHATHTLGHAVSIAAFAQWRRGAEMHGIQAMPDRC